MRRAAPVPFSAAILIATLASCVAPPAQAPAPRPVTVAPPPPVATPVPTPAASGSVEPGDWRYSRTATGSAARFGQTPDASQVALECDSANHTVLLKVLRLNPSAPPATATLRASTTQRSVAVSGGGAWGTARLGAQDAILDAMAFSRGRFALSLDGRERWLPAWPEVARVVEDCRV